MNDNSAPIITFEELTKKLQVKGFKVGNATGGYREIQPEGLSVNDFASGKMRIAPDGIFVTLEDGTEHQVYLYKKEYKMAMYGKPRYHVCNCEVIQGFTNNNGEIPKYRRTNAKEVEVIDLTDGGKKKIVKDLPLCGKCAKILRSRGNSKDLTSTAFAEMLAAKEKPKQKIIVDRNGYTEDWQKISLAYRHKKNFTCEKCGVTTGEYESFMETHHINGDKTDNSDTNLQCLCVKCHSEVDRTHYMNSNSPGHRALIRLFMDKYRDKRKNPFLTKKALQREL